MPLRHQCFTSDAWPCLSHRHLENECLCIIHTTGWIQCVRAGSMWRQSIRPMELEASWLQPGGKRGLMCSANGSSYQYNGMHCWQGTPMPMVKVAVCVCVLTFAFGAL